MECYNHNYDVMRHVVLQRYWENGKTLDLSISDTAPRKKLKLGTLQVLMENEIEFFVIGALVMTS